MTQKWRVAAEQNEAAGIDLWLQKKSLLRYVLRTFQLALWLHGSAKSLATGAHELSLPAGAVEALQIFDTSRGMCHDNTTSHVAMCCPGK